VLLQRVCARCCSPFRCGVIAMWTRLGDRRYEADCMGHYHTSARSATRGAKPSMPCAYQPKDNPSRSDSTALGPITSVAGQVGGGGGSRGAAFPSIGDGDRRVHSRRCAVQAAAAAAAERVGSGGLTRARAGAGVERQCANQDSSGCARVFHRSAGKQHHANDFAGMKRDGARSSAGRNGPNPGCRRRSRRARAVDSAADSASRPPQKPPGPAG